MFQIISTLSICRYVKWGEYRPNQALLSSLNIFQKIQYAVNQMVVIQLKCKVMTPADVNGFRGMFADSILRKYALSADTFIHPSQRTHEKHRTFRSESGHLQHCLFSACCSACTAQHSLFCPISHILLSHKGLRKACYLQTAGRCLSVCFPYFRAHRCLTTLCADHTTTDSY